MREAEVELLIDLDWKGILDVRGTMRSPNSINTYSIIALVHDNPINGKYRAKIQTLLNEIDLDCSIFELSDFNDGQIFRGDTPVVKITDWFDTQPIPR